MTRSKIRTSGAEGLTLSSTSLTVANGLTLTDGDVTLASGHGLSFAATSDASSMTSELMDDYEEGDFTPSFTQSGATVSYSGQAGVYTKIGRTVHATGRVFTSGVSGGSGAITISGLPFTSASIGFDSAAVYFNSTFSGWSNTNCPKGGFISPGQSHITIKAADSSDARDQTDTPVTSFGDGSVGLIFNAIYIST